jgi:predicted amidohydrolase YtcJ
VLAITDIEVARRVRLDLGIHHRAHGCQDLTMTDVQDIIFTNGLVRTMDSRFAGADTVVVRGDRIQAVGGQELLMPGMQRIDLGGRTLTPGFIDAHNHLSVAALHPRFGDARGVATPDDLIAAVRAHAAAEPDTEWLRLYGWHDHDGFTPTRRELDAAVSDRPVILAHFSLHQCVANSAALDRLGIGVGTPDPAGGEIGREANGEPSGYLLERAWSQAHAQSLAAYADPDRWADAIVERARVLQRDGITAVHDAACSPEAEAVYGRLAQAGALPIAVLALPHPAALLMNDVGARLDGPPTGSGDEQFRIGPIKLFADGGIAIAVDTKVGGRPLQFGIVMADLEARAIAAAERDFGLAVHAMGNRGVTATLDAFDAVRRRVGDRDYRFRIEHAGITGPNEWRRLATSDTVAVVQPGFVEHVGISAGGVHFDDHEWLAFAGLADAGVVLAGSSDDPCAPHQPLWAAALGASRRTSTGIEFEPNQAVPFDDWLHAYTAGAAFAGGQENERGSLTPGKRADLVVLDRTGDTPTVAETWIGGERVYAST